jgi:multidrug resistance efflux pump
LIVRLTPLRPAEDKLVMNPPAKFKRKRVALAAIALVILAAALYLFLGRHRALILTGVVTTDDVIVSPVVTGRLEQLLVREGDVVKEGQLLGTIQAGEWKAGLDFAQESERQAGSVVAQGRADLAYQQELTESQIKQSEANLASAEAQVAVAESDFENAQLNLQREDELHRSGADSDQAFDTARTGFSGFRARLDAARKQALAAEAAVALAKANLSQVAARRAALQGDTSALAAQSAQKEKARVELGYTELRAPIDGIVDVRAARQGEVLTPGQAVVTLVNPDDLWIRADVEESYVDGIHLGEVLTVRLPSGAERPGTVFFRGVDADYATQRDVSRTKRDIKTFEIRLRCDNHDRSLAVGMSAYVLLPVGR